MIKEDDSAHVVNISTLSGHAGAALWPMAAYANSSTFMTLSQTSDPLSHHLDIIYGLTITYYSGFPHYDTIPTSPTTRAKEQKTQKVTFSSLLFLAQLSIANVCRVILE
jgi:hypothetical protein